MFISFLIASCTGSTTRILDGLLVQRVQTIPAPFGRSTCTVVSAGDRRRNDASPYAAGILTLNENAMKQANKPHDRVQCDIMIACNHGLIRTLVRKIKTKSKE
jgi:hypothetical protein